MTHQGDWKLKKRVESRLSLDRTDILRILAQLPFHKNSFWVVMGGALVLHRIRNTTADIDIGCTNELFEQLKGCGYEISISRSGLERIDYSALVHIYNKWPTDSIENIDGISVASLASIIKDKQHFGRPKDLADIELIQQSLKGV